MSIVDEISKAIGAHSLWKQRLRDAIDSGKSEFTPAKVKVDNGCPFGSWLYGLNASDRSSPHFAAVKDLHARFHAAAADVLDLALRGKQKEAEAAFGLGSEFANASAALTGAMMKWKRELDGTGKAAA